ncbi:MAG TPA: hypothetical protein VGD51_11695, partial [Nocardioidaceae bacterium]
SPEKPSNDQSGSPLGTAAPLDGSSSGFGGPGAAAGLAASLAGVGLVLLAGLRAARRRSLASPRT